MNRIRSSVLVASLKTVRVQFTPMEGMGGGGMVTSQMYANSWEPWGWSGSLIKIVDTLLDTPTKLDFF